MLAGGTGSVPGMHCSQSQWDSHGGTAEKALAQLRSQQGHQQSLPSLLTAPCRYHAAHPTAGPARRLLRSDLLPFDNRCHSPGFSFCHLAAHTSLTDCFGSRHPHPQGNVAGCTEPTAAVSSSCPVKGGLSAQRRHQQVGIFPGTRCQGTAEAVPA